MDPRIDRLADDIKRAASQGMDVFDVVAEQREVAAKEEPPDPWGETLDELAAHRGVRVSSASPEKSKKMVRNARRRLKQGRISHDQMLDVEDRAEGEALKEIGHKAAASGLLAGLVKRPST